MKIDTIDKKILKTLQKNAKITNARLSKEIGLSPAPTLERVRKLETRGIISGYHAKLDKSKIGLGVSTYVMVSLKSHNKKNLDLFIEKIKDVESIFKTKELKLIENYEYVIKDLENKLDIEQGKFRDAAESQREEKEKMKENHRRDLERVNEEGRQMMETMKSEYLTVINNMKALKKIEMEAKQEFNNASDKLSIVSENILAERKTLDNEKRNLESEHEIRFKKKSQELETF